MGDPDVRPYWGEEPETLGEWSIHWTRVDDLPRRTFQERHDAFVREGICPACRTDLDDDGFCSCCGFNAANDRPLVTVEQQDDYSVRLPLPLFTEEYAPASVDEDAA